MTTTMSVSGGFREEKEQPGSSEQLEKTSQSATLVYSFSVL